MRAIRRVIGGPKRSLDRRHGGRLVFGDPGFGRIRDRVGASGHWGNFVPILSWMVLVHAAIGVGEAMITGLIVRFILVRRPDLFEMQEGPTMTTRASERWGQDGLAGLGMALAVAVFLSPFAYDQPDGLEFVGEKLRFLPAASSLRLVPFPAPIPDYELKLPGLEHVKVATAAAGLVGTLVVFGVAWRNGEDLACPAAMKRPRPMRFEGWNATVRGDRPAPSARRADQAGRRSGLHPDRARHAFWRVDRRWASRGCCSRLSLAWPAFRRLNWPALAGVVRPGGVSDAHGRTGEPGPDRSTACGSWPRRS